MIEHSKTVLVTGGVRGIGKSIVMGFAEHKANIIVWDVNDAGFDDLKKEVEAKSSTVTFTKVNVSDFSEVESEMDKIGKELDILINNAGITRDNLLIGMSEAEWDSVIAVNLKGTYNCSKHAVKHMIRNRAGSIINIASVIGLMGNKGQCNYAASKAGIIGFTKSLAKEVGQRGVRVNAIAPGFIETEMTAQLKEEIIEEYKKLIPLKRMGTPQDVANLCLFLASEYASYITGQVIQVDGGMLM